MAFGVLGNVNMILKLYSQHLNIDSSPSERHHLSIILSLRHLIMLASGQHIDSSPPHRKAASKHHPIILMPSFNACKWSTSWSASTHLPFRVWQHLNIILSSLWHFLMLASGQHHDQHRLISPSEQGSISTSSSHPYIIL